MKIFAIRDESAMIQNDLAYLIYYETDKTFYIELPEGSDPWNTPLLLDSFAKRRENTVNSYWSKLWVQQRIIPPDRQNITNIICDNHLDEYDEYGLLMLSMGRCAQDDYYLTPIEERALPNEIIERLEMKIEDILPLEENNLLVFFRDGQVKKCDLSVYFSENDEFRILLKKPEYFEHVRIQPGGYGVSWDVNMNIPYSVLYGIGISIPLSANDFKSFVTQRVMNASEAAEALGCSRQNILDLTKRGKLHPIKSSEKNTLYLKSEIIKRNW